MFYLPLAVVISVPVFVSLEKEIIALDAELHADLEALLIEKDSRQENLWGINLYLYFTSYFCLAKDFIKVDYKDLEKGRYVVPLGFSAMDALHLTLAEKQNVDYFITCDDSIIKLYRKHQDIMKIKVVSLLEFISLEVK